MPISQSSTASSFVQNKTRLNPKTWKCCCWQMPLKRSLDDLAWRLILKWPTCSTNLQRISASSKCLYHHLTSRLTRRLVRKGLRTKRWNPSGISHKKISSLSPSRWLRGLTWNHLTTRNKRHMEQAPPIPSIIALTKAMRANTNMIKQTCLHFSTSSCQEITRLQALLTLSSQQAFKSEFFKVNPTLSHLIKCKGWTKLTLHRNFLIKKMKGKRLFNTASKTNCS